MDLEARLRAFAAVARRHSFSAAARELSISQPAVSKHGADIEQRLGMRLVERRLTTRTIGSVISIAQVAGEAASQGPLDFLALMAFISVNLGLVNLLPVPVPLGVPAVFENAVQARRPAAGLVVTERPVPLLIVPSLTVMVVGSAL